MYFTNEIRIYVPLHIVGKVLLASYNDNNVDQLPCAHEGGDFRAPCGRES